MTTPEEIDKIERQKKKLFDRLRKLNNATSEDKLKELEELFRQKSKEESKGVSKEFCLTGIELTMDQLMEVFNDISDETNCPFKYTKVKIGRRYQKK